VPGSLYNGFPLIRTCGCVQQDSGARPVHLIITMIKWIRTSRLSIKNSLSAAGQRRREGLDHHRPVCRISVTVSVGTSLCPYRIAYRWVYGLSTSGLFKRSFSSSLLLSPLELSDTKVYEPQIRAIPLTSAVWVEQESGGDKDSITIAQFAAGTRKPSSSSLLSLQVLEGP